jgi:uncharacterized protein (TIGR02611 family)
VKSLHYSPNFPTNYLLKSRRLRVVENKRRPLVVRMALVVAGVAMVLAGLAGLVLPVVPGWLLIFSGLAVLAGEFVWARTLLDTAKAKAGEVASKIPTKGKNRAA